MKLIAIAVSVFSAVNSQALTAECGLGNLIVDIPYPDERTAKLLYLTAGSCNETNYAGSTFYDDTKSVFQITIPIEPCGLKDELYGTPVSRSTGGLYMPTANVTLGEKMGSMDVIFRNMVISAECGLKTSYKIGFNYSDIASSDKEGCHEVNGVCVFPAYESGVTLEVKEYTDDTFTTVIDDSNQDLRHNLAGQTIYLSMRGSVPDGYKYAVTECAILSNGNRFTIMEPGASTGATCELDGIGLSAFYDDGNFNFQHVLFLLGDAATVSSFELQCDVQICDETDAVSACNKAVLPCMDTEEKKEEYMCEGFNCDVNQECDLENDIPVCVSSRPVGYPDPVTMGCGWTLVRHKPSNGRTFKATDTLVGSEVYGTADDNPYSPDEWSIKFDNSQFDQFMFATSDYEHWGIVTKSSVDSGRTANDGGQDLDFIGSSLNSGPHTVREAMWYMNSGSGTHHPHISLLPHCGKVLGEAGRNCGLQWLQLYQGAGQVQSEDDFNNKVGYSYPIGHSIMNIFIRESTNASC